ncbi:MAG: glycosyltransferase family 4 protein [Patescibacteria group bacterium]|jgi:glycosyltransferase involved in cell wall biosynthesis
MKKITLLHFSYPPNIGGVEVFIKEQAKILAKLGYEITILTGSGKEVDPGIRLIQIPELQSIYNTNKALYEEIMTKGTTSNGFLKLAKIIEDKITKEFESQDVIIVHNMLSLTHNIPFIYAFKKYVLNHEEKRVISWIHDHKYIGFDKVRIKDFSLPPDVNNLLTEKIDDVKYIAISNSLKNLVSKVTNLKSEEITVIPNGVNIKEFLEIDDSVFEIFEKNNLMERFPVILSPVNIIERKNIEFSLDILFHLKKVYPNFAYIITGKISHHKEGEKYLQMLNKKIDQYNLKNNVIFLNESIKRSLHKSEIHDFYSLCDIIFYFSKSENFGLPLLEATLTKTPIFLSDLLVFREVGGENFSYIDYENTPPGDVAKKIVDFLENNKLISMNRVVKENYDLTNLIKKNLIPIIEK